MNQNDYNKRFWVIMKMITLRHEIPQRIQNQTGSNNPKIIKYLKKAFSRWVFNMIMNGRDPFVILTRGQPVTASEFVMDVDIKYLFNSIDSMELLFHISWDWLDREFIKIANGPRYHLTNFPVQVAEADPKNFQIRSQ